MSCDHCPHCQSEVPKGGLSLPGISNNQEKSNNEERETPKRTVRGKAREYTEAFEIAWKTYARKEQKFEAFAIWMLRAREVGGERELLQLVLVTLKWQNEIWSKEGYQFTPYFERYLKRRKWEDERPPQLQAVPRRIDDRLSQGTDRKLAELRSHAERRATPEELAALRGGNRG